MDAQEYIQSLNAIFSDVRDKKYAAQIKIVIDRMSDLDRVDIMMIIEMHARALLMRTLDLIDYAHTRDEMHALLERLRHDLRSIVTSERVIRDRVEKLKGYHELMMLQKKYGIKSDPVEVIVQHQVSLIMMTTYAALDIAERVLHKQ